MGQALFEKFCILEQGASHFPVEELLSSGTRTKISTEMDCDNDIKEDVLSLYASTTSGDVNLFHGAVITLETKIAVG
uniref:Uncharacterized protein n=1 Tax=Strongyloides papillosus TaxID=174720 RepID=A0A0N5CD78_STREA